MKDIKYLIWALKELYSVLFEPNWGTYWVSRSLLIIFTVSPFIGMLIGYLLAN